MRSVVLVRAWVVVLGLLAASRLWAALVPERRGGVREEQQEDDPALLFGQAGRAACEDLLRNRLFYGDPAAQETERVVADLAVEAVCASADPDDWIEQGCRWVGERLDAPAPAVLADALEWLCGAVAGPLLGREDVYRHLALRWAQRCGLPSPHEVLTLHFPDLRSLLTDLRGGAERARRLWRRWAITLPNLAAPLHSGVLEIGRHCANVLVFLLAALLHPPSNAGLECFLQRLA